MIELKNLSKSFNNPILKNVNLKLNCGNIYILKGISGSGKTTLLNILSGLDKDYEGNILINGKDLKKFKNKDLSNYQSNIGYIMQKSLLFKNLNILDNLKIIDNNCSQINNLTKHFNVNNILNNMPSTISGGERQRIALIRSLLKKHKIIIADEPTSSLDRVNSLNFVNYLKDIDYSDKIIIIATHKNIYDEIATSIININYGTVKETKLKETNNSELKLEKNKNKLSLKFIWNNRKSFGWFFNIIMVIFIATILLVTSIKLKYQSEYIKVGLKDYPYNILDTNNFLASEITNIIEEKYDNYIINESDFTVHPLLKKENSIFKRKELIANGTFPKNNEEILINRELAIIKYPNLKLNDIVGKKIKIKNKDYTISGIINNEFIYDIYAGYYYDIRENDSILPVAFLDYDTMKKIGTLKSTGLYDEILVKIKDEYIMELYTTKKYERQFGSSSGYFLYLQKFNHLTNDTKHISNMTIIVMISITILLLVFLSNQISLELFYKKKEIGYLQIFNFSKKQIKCIYISEYILNILKDFIFAFIIYIIFIIYKFIKQGFNYLINPIFYLIILVILILYSLVIIYLPLRKILKEKIIDLIK